MYVDSKTRHEFTKPSELGVRYNYNTPAISSLIRIHNPSATPQSSRRRKANTFLKFLTRKYVKKVSFLAFYPTNSLLENPELKDILKKISSARKSLPAK